LDGKRLSKTLFSGNIGTASFKNWKNTGLFLKSYF